ncbi:MAG: hypothetical protein M3Q89_03910, partial [Verrucomicrobiota bacterium]|nr:hypothetical protein [Verrucomicrobiota bacterium]
MRKADLSRADIPAARVFAGPMDPEAGALRWERRICVMALTAVLFVAVILGCFAHPLADDFARAYKAHAHGIVPSTIREYFTWSGRWASAGMNYSIMSAFDLVRFYPLLLGITSG